MVPPRSPPAARFSSSLPRSHSVIRPTTGSGGRAELGRVCILDAGERARRLDDGHLHAEADAEIRHLALAGEAGRPDLALGAALAEAAGHQDAVNALQKRRRILALEDLALDPVEVDLDLVGDAAVVQRLDERLVGVLQARVLADDGDGDLALGIVRRARRCWSSGTGSGAGASSMPKAARTSLSRPGLVIGERHVVDRGRVARLDHRRLAHVAEQGELAALVLRDLAVGAAEQDVGLDADGAQLRDGMLGRLGLQLAGRGDEGQQRQVDVDRLPARQIVAELADRLEERQALDVADRAADLDQHEVEALVAGEHEVLDGVGDVRDHLDRRAEIIAAPLLGDDVEIDPARW